MTRETDALKKPFLIGVLFVVIVVVLLGGLIALFGSTDDRPEGVAERWLTAVGDTTRKGMHDEAVDRVNERGPFALGEPLLGTGRNYDGKSAFTELEVGKADRSDATTALVPFRLRTRVPDNAAPVLGAVLLRQEGDKWFVSAVQLERPGLKVPSEGGDASAKAPITLYVVALAIGVGVAAAASALVRAAGREHERSLLA